MDPKKPKYVQPIRFYPILPRVKRTKTSVTEGKLSIVNSAIMYRHARISERRLISDGSKSIWLNEDAMFTSGANNIRTFHKNPGWRQLIAKGGDATDPYSRSVGTLKTVQYGGTTTGFGYISQSRGSISGTLLVNSMDTTDLRDAAVGRLKHKLNGYIGNAQIAPPLAESREIHRLVRQINDLGMSTLRSALAIKKTRGKSALKQFGDIWLGFGFGLNPMLKDIQSAAEAVIKYTIRQDHRVRVVGTAKREYHSAINPTVGENIAYGTDLAVASSAHHTQGVRIVAGIDLTVRSAASYSVADHLGLKISEIPATLWELTPYSWAIDYFTTVSPWLDDMFFTLPGVTKYVSQTTKYQLETTFSTRVIDSPGFKFAGSVSPGVFKYVSIVRASLATLPSRQLRVKSLDEIAMHSTTKLLNLASVLAGRASPNLSGNNKPRGR